MFREITLHDFAAPPRARAVSRKCCGPYRHRPAAPGAGLGLYMESGPRWGGLECARHGSRVSLRVIEGSRRFSVDMGETFVPIVLRLPHERGFLPGWTLGPGMCASVETDDIWADERDAMRRAEDLAEAMAEAEADREEACSAGADARMLARDAREACGAWVALTREMPARPGPGLARAETRARDDWGAARAAFLAALNEKPPGGEMLEAWREGYANW